MLEKHCTRDWNPCGLTSYSFSLNNILFDKHACQKTRNPLDAALFFLQLIENFHSKLEMRVPCTEYGRRKKKHTLYMTRTRGRPAKFFLERIPLARPLISTRGMYGDGWRLYALISRGRCQIWVGHRKAKASTKGFQAARAIKYQLSDRREHEDPLKGGWRFASSLSLPGEQILQFSQHFYHRSAHTFLCRSLRRKMMPQSAHLFSALRARGSTTKYLVCVRVMFLFHIYLLGNLLCAATQPKVNCLPFPCTAGKTAPGPQWIDKIQQARTRIRMFAHIASLLREQH